jgi:hypothetical protein
MSRLRFTVLSVTPPPDRMIALAPIPAIFDLQIAEQIGHYILFSV